MLLAIPNLPELVRHITLAPFLAKRETLTAGYASIGIELVELLIVKCHLTTPLDTHNKLIEVSHMGEPQ